MGLSATIRSHGALRDTLRDHLAAYLMACAKNGVDYKLAREVGMRVGIGSVETFSRRKFELRDLGIIEEEAVREGNVGRPRLRLLFNNEAFRRIYPEG